MKYTIKIGSGAIIHTRFHEDRLRHSKVVCEDTHADKRRER
jgi:hypothetical protein